MIKKERTKNVLFGAAIGIIIVLMILDLFKKSEFTKDCVFMIAAIVIFYLIENEHPLPNWAIGTSLFPLVMHVVGVSFNLYSMTFFGIGFDKYQHFFASFCVTIVAFYWLTLNSNRHFVKKALVALLIMQGFGALNEVNEFVGSQYLHIQGSTMFSQGDNLPKLMNDMQTYDTWWDMMFNLFGSVAAVVILVIVTYRSHRTVGIREREMGEHKYYKK